jgi:hypothetical protein
MIELASITTTGSAVGSATDVIVDVGTNFSLLPADATAAIRTLFGSSGSSVDGKFFVSCAPRSNTEDFVTFTLTADVGTFAVKVRYADLVIDNGNDNSCSLAIADPTQYETAYGGPRNFTLGGAIARSAYSKSPLCPGSWSVRD